jgi:hypothetical protein
MLPLVLATEVWLLVLNHPYFDRRRRQRSPVRALWRQRIMVTGLAPVYMKATLQALVNGPRRKPVYTVTRKEDDLRWHWRHTLPQTAVVLLIPIVAIYALVHGRLPEIGLVAGTLYWGALNIVLLGGFVTRGWHGVAGVHRGARRAARALAPAPVGPPRAQSGARSRS